MDDMHGRQNLKISPLLCDDKKYEFWLKEQSYKKEWNAVKLPLSSNMARKWHVYIKKI